jgi:hypothetical protein
VIVSCHSEKRIGTREDLLDLARFRIALRGAVEWGILMGKSKEDLAKSLTFPKYRNSINDNIWLPKSVELMYARGRSHKSVALTTLAKLRQRLDLQIVVGIEEERDGQPSNTMALGSDPVTALIVIFLHQGNRRIEQATRALTEFISESRSARFRGS